MIVTTQRKVDTAARASAVEAVEESESASELLPAPLVPGQKVPPVSSL